MLGPSKQRCLDRPVVASLEALVPRDHFYRHLEAVLDVKHTGQRTLLGYHDHYVVDGGKDRIILYALVTPADVMEHEPMLDLLRRVSFRWHLRPRRAVA